MIILSKKIFINIILLNIVFYAGCRTALIKNEIYPEIPSRTFATIYFNEGIMFNNEGNYIQAIDSFTEAINIDTSFQGAYTARGSTYYILRMYSEALQDFDRAISLGPQDFTHHGTAFYMRGRTYIGLEEYEKAIIDFTRVLAVRARSSEIYNDRSSAYYHIGRYTEAIADITIAINLDSSKYSYFDNRAALYYILNDYSKALEDLNMSLRLNPNNAFVHSNCGNIYLILEKYEEALYEFNKSIELDMTNKEVYKNRGNLYIRLAELSNDENKRNEYQRKAEADFEREATL